MSFRSQWFAAPTITGLVSGTQSGSTLLNNRKTYALGLLFTAVITIAGAVATAIRNGGSILAAYEELGFSDNGVKRLQFDPLMAGFLSGALMPSARTRQLLTSTAIAATTLREMVILFFGQGYQLDPMETAYREQDPNALLQAYVIPNASITTGVAIATAGGGGTVAVTAATVEVTQYYDLDTAKLPLLRPYVETRDFPIAVSGPNQEFSLRTDRWLRALMFKGDSIQAAAREMDTTILTAFALRSDARYLVGENPLSVASLQFFNDQWQGESFANTAFLLFPFTEFGRLSKVVDPREDKNLRALLTANPSTVGGATGSRVRCALIGLERIAGVTATDVPFLDAQAIPAVQTG